MTLHIKQPTQYHAQMKTRIRNAHSTTPRSTIPFSAYGSTKKQVVTYNFEGVPSSQFYCAWPHGDTVIHLLFEKAAKTNPENLF